MQISSLYDSNPVQWESRRNGLLEFLREYGEQRITLRGCRRLARLTPDQLALPGVSCSLPLCGVRTAASSQASASCPASARRPV